VVEKIIEVPVEKLVDAPERVVEKVVEVIKI